MVFPDLKIWVQNVIHQMVQVKSSASWTNEEFGKIYEPVSATELRRQHQVRHGAWRLQIRFVSFELHENGEIKGALRR